MSAKPMGKLVIASQNQGKIAELKRLLAPLGVELVSALDLNLPDVEEDQDTFKGNATKKALAVAKATGLMALSDDSGLCVDALDGAPGVFTARYGTYERLLKEIAHIPNDKRGAEFVCALALADPLTEEIKVFKGVVKGNITLEPKGEGGFGYDPVFTPEGYSKTFAEMESEQKSVLSHRGKALALLVKHLSNS